MIPSPNFANLEKIKLFGTDGIRSRAGQFPLDEESVELIARLSGELIFRSSLPRKVLLAHDTRVSCFDIERALTRGLTSVGVDVVQLGVMPTPGVSYLVQLYNASGGVMISASHNSYEDNGIKFFDHQGYKISKEQEGEIEELFYQRLQRENKAGLASKNGKITEDLRGRTKYQSSIKEAFNFISPSSKIKIVVDCAQGAVSSFARKVLAHPNVEARMIGNRPNGFNINDHCGSTFPQLAQQAVIQKKAEVGICFDGDGDRVIFIDEHGRLINGDQILAILARWMLEEGRLTNRLVVGTVMANMGLQRYIESLGCSFLRVPVGDYYVGCEMRQQNAALGGESSGHIIIHPYRVTGDGLFVARCVLSLWLKSGQPFSEFATLYHSYPQVLQNIKIQDPFVLALPKVQGDIRSLQESLGEGYHFVVRPSGTEPLIRVMGQGEDLTILNKSIDTIIQIIKANSSMRFS